MSNFDKEREEYKLRVGKQKDVIANLLDLSEKHLGLFDSTMQKQLKEFQKKCDKLYKKLDKNEFEISIVGLEKAGKSTFGNALIENRILPDADERCTYTSTCIRFGKDRAIVKFFTAAEMDCVLRGYLNTLGIENTESYTYKGLSNREYFNLFNNLEQHVKDTYENTVHQDIINLLENKQDIFDKYIGKPDKIFEGETLYEDDFKKYIVSPKVAVAVREVNIESSKLGKMPNAVIYDVPGFDSPTSMHLEQTKMRMKEADAIMLIASAEKPSFTAPALKIFQEVVDEDNLSLSDKLFIFGNRADAANTLKKNIDTLKKEAKRWKLLGDDKLEERLIIGSAKAHLQKLNIINGDNCVKIVEENEEYKAAWQHGDGIQYAYDKLVEYNQYERFPIVKKKIRKNNEDLKAIFNDWSRHCEDGCGVDLSKLISSLTSLKLNAKKSIQRNLEILRNDIRKKYKRDLILSRRLQDKVSKLFDDEERYLINSEDIENAELKIIDTSGSTNVEKVEEIIREDKFNQIYEDFSKSAFVVAQTDHIEYYNSIIQCVEKSLYIDKKSPSYRELHKMVIQFVEKYIKNEEDEFIYQSIIERFVRDIIEILIYRPYSSEARLNKFVDEAEVFSGLVMFYNPGDANEGYKHQFLSVAPNNQPLLLSLVFHDYKDADESSKDIFSYMSGICRSLCRNPEVVRLVFSVIKGNPIGALDTIKRIITKELCKGCKTEEDYIRKIIPALRNIKNSTSSEVNEKYDFDFSNSKAFERQYKNFFGNKEVRSYDDICEFFKVDLKILEKFLIHASIPAISLEKPFVSREIQSINKLLKAMDSEEFDKMVDENSKILLPHEYEEINEATADLFANKAAVDDIKKLMKTLENGVE